MTEFAVLVRGLKKKYVYKRKSIILEKWVVIINVSIRFWSVFIVSQQLPFSLPIRLECFVN